ncbi:MAG: aminoacyl-tRNA hydrolase [Pseudomonadota bacterium]
MQLFVGLGNPGAKYSGNRHNIGFRAVDRIAEDNGFAPFRSKFHGQVSEGRLGIAKVLILRPDTFMNRSGQAVGAAAQFYKIAPENIVVFHDEIDLAPGKLRVKSGGGHAGHNGLRSIHSTIGPDYGRVRIGVGHPGHKDAVPGYVLRDFAKADADWIEDLLQGISDGALALAQGDTGRFQNAVALRLKPPRKGPGQPGAPVTDEPAKAGPKDKAEPAPDRRSPLQRLADKFR